MLRVRFWLILYCTVVIVSLYMNSVSRPWMDCVRVIGQATIPMAIDRL